jgi:hypothetical protein
VRNGRPSQRCGVSLSPERDPGESLGSTRRAFASSHRPGDEKANADPGDAENLGVVAEMNPYESATRIPSEGIRAGSVTFLRAELVANESSRVDADECAEVEKFCALIVEEKEGPS